MYRIALTATKTFLRTKFYGYLNVNKQSVSLETLQCNFDPPNEHKISELRNMKTDNVTYNRIKIK